MTVEPLEQVIKLWETSQITSEQAIGKHYTTEINQKTFQFVTSFLNQNE